MEILFFICVMMSALGIFFYAYKNRHELEKQRHIPKEDKVNFTNFEKLFQSPEEIYKEEIKNGTVIVNPPSKFSIPNWIVIVILLSFIVGFFFVCFEIFSFLQMYAKNCKDILGINAKLLMSILYGISILTIPFCYKPSKKALKQIQNGQSQEFYPSKRTQYKFSYAICRKIDDAMVEEYQQKYKSGRTSFFLCSLLVIPIGGFVVFSDINIPFNQLMNANEIYKQKCIAKEPPFDRL